MNARTFAVTTLAALLAVLTLVSSVWAECAWVLWWEETNSSFRYLTAEAKVVGAKTDRSDDHSWNLLGAYSTDAACRSQQAWKSDEMLKTRRKEKAEAKFGQHTINYESGSNIISK